MAGASIVGILRLHHHLQYLVFSIHLQGSMIAAQKELYSYQGANNFYIGKTERYFRQRIYEHQYNISKHNTTNALVRHGWEEEVMSWICGYLSIILSSFYCLKKFI